ncbi:HEAT repeat domain-containing protein [Streptomyces parvulus]|uniref:HEAT repeat domain-containing protein n=1 Tax=Streptomyces parvulus TaxID=146923 RepID=UPI0033328D29
MRSRPSRAGAGRSHQLARARVRWSHAADAHALGPALAARYRHAVVPQLANLTWRQRRKARRCSRILRRHRDAAIRQDACRQLERTGAPGAAQTLADAAAHDENHYVRATTLMALAGSTPVPWPACSTLPSPIGAAWWWRRRSKV